MASSRRIATSELDRLAPTDYVSAFRLDTDHTAVSAERWARGVFEGAPAIARLMVGLGWRYALGLRLSSQKSPDLVAGWSVVENTADRFAMHAESRSLRAHNRVEVDDTGVLWVTTVDFSRRLGRILWTVAAPIHHATIPLFLRHADRSITKG